MALNALGITAAIAAQSVSGVTIYDVSNTPDKFEQRSCPALCPNPGTWLGAAGAGAGAGEEESTFGTPTTRYWHVHRELQYTYLHGMVGTERETNKLYNTAPAKLEAIFLMFIQLDVSGVDVEQVTHTPVGVVTDASGAQFIGTNWTVTVRERINA